MAEDVAVDVVGDAPLAEFLQAAGIAGANLELLVSGLSAKRFYRVAARDLVVLDARSTPGLTERYVAIAGVIAGKGVTVPKVYYADHTAGFALVEYLGDRPLSRLIDESRDKRPWFMAATQALAALHGLAPPDSVALPTMAAPRIAAEVQTFGHILSHRLGGGDESANFLSAYAQIWAEISLGFPQFAHLVLADTEPENLMHVAGGDGARIGILDFDDAFIGDQAYDLASLVESARRTTDPNIVVDCINLYARLTGADVHALTRRVALWSLQRHLRILGIFLDPSRPTRARFASYVPNLMACVRRNLHLEPFAPLSQLFATAGIEELTLASHER